MRAPWAVVCDFDGTATVEDLGDGVSIHFAGYRHWRESEDLFTTGAFPFSTLLSRIFEPITASREEIAAFAREQAVLRPGFDRLVAGCREASRPFVICSAGLDAYIEPVLDRLAPELRAHLDIRCNRATCSSTGLRVEFHGAGAGCGQCGFCKGPVVKELQAAGHKVVFCGDGTADRCAAEAAEVVFARRSLVTYCESKGIPFHPFETFDEVIAAFPR
jgi:2-hydroxy-3-keto-5-methylthiopentenyl-1-phosphate phosphatase